MAMKGRLSEFSLAEIFRLMEQSQKTGLLTIRASHETSQPLQNFYIWFKQGQIVAAANRLDSRGLATLIHQREWLGEQSKPLLVEALQSDRPLGLHLKVKGSLTAEQLKLLFYTQVMRQVCSIFRFPEGWFSFEAQVHLPVSEMTGLTAVPTEVTLEGLRALRDWSALAHKLPDPNSMLVNTTRDQSQFHINQMERQIWELAKSKETLLTMATTLQQSIEKVQQIAFRLILVGLVEEVPLVIALPNEPLTGDLSHELSTASSQQISHSFLQNLMGFLSGRTVAQAH
ncbi:MAG: DUF4388 domain-containing protein [Elainella sp. Prado103]|jgi:hypothetical protein|nr:DUF4388 domain-containing protein [Elainella sp. Prado103]